MRKNPKSQVCGQVNLEIQLSGAKRQALAKALASGKESILIRMYLYSRWPDMGLYIRTTGQGHFVARYESPMRVKQGGIL